jgi:hypothetical protein
MELSIRDIRARLATRILVAVLVFLGLLLVGIGIATAGSIIPSIGITRPAHDDDAKSDIYGGLAVRGGMLPGLEAEVGVAYRSESRLNGDLKVRQWPVTASLWVTALPVIYAGGGAGWYHTTLDYADTLPLESETHSRFGLHLGGGLDIPLGPAAAIDLNGRYVFLETEQSQLPPNEWDPDFWSTTLGLAIQF